MKKTTGKKRKVWLIILLAFVIFICCILLAAYLLFKHYYGMLNIEHYDDYNEDQNTETTEEYETVPGTDGIYESESSDTVNNPETSEMIYDSESIGDSSVENTTSSQTEDSTVAVETEEEVHIEVTQGSSDLFEGLEVSERIFRIMLIGVDSREDDDKGRSDSMILFDINPETKKIVMTSFLRDIYIAIPGHNPNRINASYALGGPSLLSKTIYSSFGIEVDKYVTINFGIVEDVVDAFGGVEIVLTKAEIDYINKIMTSEYKLPAQNAGKVCLNGKQALTYARIRYLDSDFGRTERQRKVVTACIDKLKKMSIAQINDMLEEFLPRVTTNLTEKDVLNLLFMALRRKDYSTESMAIPVAGTWKYATVQGKAVISIDFAANSKAWYDKVTGN